MTAAQRPVLVQQRENIWAGTLLKRSATSTDYSKTGDCPVLKGRGFQPRRYSSENECGFSR